jgi:hypothetical protein
MLVHKILVQMKCKTRISDEHFFVELLLEPKYGNTYSAFLFVYFAHNKRHSDVLEKPMKMLNAVAQVCVGALLNLIIVLGPFGIIQGKGI